MIKINGFTGNPEKVHEEISNNQEQLKILQQIDQSNTVYQYITYQQFQFELTFREETINAAKELNNSGSKFTTFAYAFCNKKYWYRLANGGFLVREEVQPSVALLDILKNGSLYAFECSTAVAIVLYIATLKTIGEKKFNQYFSNLYLMDWHFDEDLPVYQKEGGDYLIGDCLHFKNPDFDPNQSHWRAENVIYFGDDLYYGHGIGIRNSETIINFLNSKRKKEPTQSAYLMKLISRPHYPTLFNLKVYG